MQQVLFTIPLHYLWQGLPDIPIYGYGAMLFLAFIFCVWLAARLAKQYGVASPEVVQDLAIWIFVAGIAGARLNFMIQYYPQFSSPLQFFSIWDGGLVFYGSLFGGTAGFLLAYYFLLRRHNVSGWKMADVIAPCLTLGLCLGRVGCLLNGCCYGNVACADCPAISFPLASAPRSDMTARGFQTAAGFTLADRLGNDAVVGTVEKGSPAAEAGLQSGDVIVKVNGIPIATQGTHNADASTLNDAFGRNWPRGQNNLSLTVRREGREIVLPPFTHRTIGLHPTQLYETISAGLLLFLLLSFYPFRQQDGDVIVLFLLCYAVHRFFNEMLRDDTLPINLPFTDISTGMTYSQNTSILVFAVGAILGIWLWTRPRSPAKSAVPVAA